MTHQNKNAEATFYDHPIIESDDNIFETQGYQRIIKEFQKFINASKT